MKAPFFMQLSGLIDNYLYGLSDKMHFQVNGEGYGV